MSMGRWVEGHPNELTIAVGPGAGVDIRGKDNVALQAAVDYCAGVGGGTVLVRAGRYTMHDSLHLRSRVTVRGAGEETVLRKPPSVQSALSNDIAFGHSDVSLSQPDKFRPGMGVYIYDDAAGNFIRTVATLTYRDGDRFGINRPLQYDYVRQRHAVVVSVYPLISGYEVEGAAVESLALDGNGAHNAAIEGCRGGAIYALGCRDLRCADIAIHDYNGDGVSWQQNYDLVFEEIRVSGCQSGFHPGSGSTRWRVSRCVSQDNRGEGLFYCVRTTEGIVEDSLFARNAGNGLNCGNRDTDHIIRRCQIRDNGGAGILFRELDYAAAGHRVQVRDNVIEGNCRKDGLAEVDLTAELEGIVIEGNMISPSKGKAGIRIAAGVRSVEIGSNKITGAGKLRVVDERV
jgi:polygalacturonase